MNNMYFLKRKISDFFKVYGAYVVAVGLLIVLTISIVLVSMFGSSSTPVTNEGNLVIDKPTINDAPVSSVVTYALPLKNPSISMGYFDMELVYNNSLKQWETHKSLDLTSLDSTDVMSIADGVVEDVYSNYLEGNVIVISHGDV